MEVAAVARLLAATGDLERAHRAYRHAKKLSPHDPSLEVEHAELLRRLGRAGEALEQLKAAVRRFRRGDVCALAVVECALGEHYRDAGELRLALSIAERWLTHRDAWELATFLWVDCVTLGGASLEESVKRAIERGNASPAMFHALLRDLPTDFAPAATEAILAIGDEILFHGWLDAIPEMRKLAERLRAGGEPLSAVAVT